MPEISNKLAGHAPANIVGGKRVPGPRTRTDSTGSGQNNSNRKDSSIDSTSSDDKAEQQSAPQASNVTAATIVDGVSMRLEEAYPVEAVRKFHEKPVPTHAKIEHANPAHNNHKHQGALFQPRKQAQ